VSGVACCCPAVAAVAVVAAAQHHTAPPDVPPPPPVPVAAGAFIHQAHELTPGLISMSWKPAAPPLRLPPRENECRLAPADSDEPRLLSVGRLLSSADDCRPNEEESSNTSSYCNACNQRDENWHHT
jgi:hypothetical protein